MISGSGRSTTFDYSSLAARTMHSQTGSTGRQPSCSSQSPY